MDNKEILVPDFDKWSYKTTSKNSQQKDTEAKTAKKEKEITGTKTLKKKKKLNGKRPIKAIIVPLIAGIAIGTFGSKGVESFINNNRIILESLPEDELNNALDTLGISQEQYDQFIELGKKINYVSDDDKEELESYASELANLSLRILKSKIANVYNVSSEEVEVSGIYDGVDDVEHFISIGDEQIDISSNHIISKTIDNIISLNYEISRTAEREEEEGINSEDLFDQNAIIKRYNKLQNLLFDYTFSLDLNDNGKFKKEDLTSYKLDDLIPQDSSTEQYATTDDNKGSYEVVTDNESAYEIADNDITYKVADDDDPER